MSGLRGRFRGVIALTVTPFKQDGSVDLKRLRENVSYLIERGADVLVVNGSCGECYALTLEEQKQVIKAAVDEANGRVPVVAGTSHSGTDIAIELSRYAEDVGADGVQVIPPYYYAGDVVEHYLAISKEVDIGVVVYNNPEVVGFVLEPETLLEMVEKAGNIVGVKDCTEDMVMAAEAVRLLRGKAEVVCGTGEALAPFFYLIGARGTYTSIVNFAPRFPVEMVGMLERGDYAGAMKLHARLLPLFRFIRDHRPFIRVIKAGMELVGRPTGKPRLPLTPLSGEEMEELRGILERLGQLE